MTNYDNFDNVFAEATQQQTNTFVCKDMQVII